MFKRERTVLIHIRLGEFEIDFAAHFGIIIVFLTRGEDQEDYISNADETHFTVDLNNGKKLGFSGENDVKYADVLN